MRRIPALVLLFIAIHRTSAQSPDGGIPQTYFEFQVTKPVGPKPGNVSPRYPDSLRVASIEGEVLAQFVVDTTGHADMSTFHTLKMTHHLFAQAVRAALPAMEFTPAEIEGRKVRQLVAMPFQFNVTRTPRRGTGPTD